MTHCAKYKVLLVPHFTNKKKLRRAQGWEVVKQQNQDSNPDLDPRSQSS